jgi:putative tricarboxylic transport membrane protein
LNRDQASSGLFFVAGCLICYHSLPYKLGTLAAPESGLMPFLSGAAICLLAAIGFGTATLRRLRGERWEALLRGRGWQRGLLTVVALLAFVLLLRPLGFLLTTALFIAFLLRAIVPQRWPLVVAVSVLTAAFAYLVFEVWLKAQLPTGPLGI